MISYGDANPTEKAIKMMHSQIQTLFSKIFFKTLKLNSAEIKKYIYKIFEEDVNNYEEFIKLYKNATKGTKKKEDSEDDFPDSSEEQV